MGWFAKARESATNKFEMFFINLALLHIFWKLHAFD